MSIRFGIKDMVKKTFLILNLFITMDYTFPNNHQMTDSELDRIIEIFENKHKWIKDLKK